MTIRTTESPIEPQMNISPFITPLDARPWVKINRNPKLMDRANNIPRYVATPFPPLNFNQKGKICPKKASKAESCIYSGK